MNQTNCPVCDFPDSVAGYHCHGKYTQGNKCDGCGYWEKTPVTVTELQISQKCIVQLDEKFEVLVFLDWTIPTDPKIRSCHQRTENGKLSQFDPNELDKKVILYYARDMWSRWLKMT